MMEFINTIFAYGLILYGIGIIIVWVYLIRIVYWPNCSQKGNNK